MAVTPHRFTWIVSVQLAILDLGALTGCAMLAALLHGQSLAEESFTPLSGIVVAIICWIGLLVIGGYEAKRDMGTLRYSSEHALTMGAVLLASLIATYSFATFNNSIKPGRYVLIVAIILFAILSLLYRYYFSRKLRESAPERPVYVIGTRAMVENLEATCARMHFQHPLRFIELEAGGQAAAIEALGSDEVRRCEAVVLDLPRVRMDPAWEEMLLQLHLHAVPVYPVEAFIESYFRKIDLSHVTITDALDGTFKPDLHYPYGNIKVLLDRTFAALLLIALLPVLLFIGLLIRILDGTPVLFRQTRMGRFEQPFLLYKFRTMTVSSGENAETYTSKQDPRITPVGRLLRLCRLDELPQLWNVVKGDMSIIGPRAEWDRLVEKYKKEIPFYHLRSMVKPGITGWAQVNYGYGASVHDSEEKLQYDLYYIKHYSPEMDASIVLKTLYVMLSASGR
jgi:exopolysaccharide biosynthesis polyprenyl glycosylphosphotransferase